MREIYLMPIIESALGVENAFEIATASRSVVAMAIGLEDYTADLGVKRTQRGKESLYARIRLVNACKAAGIQPIDSVYSDVANMDGLRKNVETSRSLGFEGMGCIHPRQVPVIKKAFIPTQDEIEKALLIVKAFEKAEARGSGVVALGSKMIDPPVVKRAQKTLELASKLKS
jgi:citrate lyase subunit beta/citryl-CoA lyase